MAHLFKRAPGPLGLTAKEARFDLQLMRGPINDSSERIPDPKTSGTKMVTKKSRSKTGRVSKNHCPKVIKTTKPRIMHTTLENGDASEPNIEHPAVHEETIATESIPGGVVASEGTVSEASEEVLREMCS